MKKNYIVSLLLLTLTIGMVACSANGTKNKNESHQHEHVQQYTCPMHPQVVKDQPGTCPICGMDLVPKQAGTDEKGVDTSLTYLLKPVNEQVVSSIPTTKAESGTRIFSEEVQGRITYDTRKQTSIASRVSGRIERLLIKYNYQPVQKGQLIMEIYSPDLAAAQRELLFIQQNGGEDNLMQKAKQRLLLLGMQPAQINHVLKMGKPLYRVPVYSNASGYILETSAVNASAPSGAASQPAASSGGDGMSGMGGGNAASAAPAPSTSSATSSPVLIREGQYVGAGQSLFTIYKADGLVAEFALQPKLASQIKIGQKLVFHLNSAPEKVYTGSIGLIQPTLRGGENFTLTRVYIGNTGLQVGQLVSASIPIVQRGWWLPKSAVWQLGNKAVVFKKEGNVFLPKEVKTGIITKGLVQVLDSIGDWPVAGNAYYLIDSESFVKINSDTNTQQ